MNMLSKSSRHGKELNFGMELSELLPFSLYIYVSLCLNPVSNVFLHIFEEGKLTSLTNAMVLLSF